MTDAPKTVRQRNPKNPGSTAAPQDQPMTDAPKTVRQRNPKNPESTAAPQDQPMTDAPAIAEPVTPVAARVEAAQEEPDPNTINRAVLGQNGWVCPAPKPKATRI